MHCFLRCIVLLFFLCALVFPEGTLIRGRVVGAKLIGWWLAGGKFYAGIFLLDDLRDEVPKVQRGLSDNGGVERKTVSRTKSNKVKELRGGIFIIIFLEYNFPYVLLILLELFQHNYDGVLLWLIEWV